MSGVEQEDRPEFAQVFHWRRDVLEEAGYDRTVADLLASQFDVDLHDAAALIRAGCDQAVAVKILL